MALASTARLRACASGSSSTRMTETSVFRPTASWRCTSGGSGWPSPLRAWMRANTACWPRCWSWSSTAWPSWAARCTWTASASRSSRARCTSARARCTSGRSPGLRRASTAGDRSVPTCAAASSRPAKAACRSGVGRTLNAVHQAVHDRALQAHHRVVGGQPQRRGAPEGLRLGLVQLHVVLGARLPAAPLRRQQPENEMADTVAPCTCSRWRCTWAATCAAPSGSPRWAASRAHQPGALRLARRLGVPLPAGRAQHRFGHSALELWGAGGEARRIGLAPGLGRAALNGQLALGGLSGVEVPAGRLRGRALSGRVVRRCGVLVLQGPSLLAGRPRRGRPVGACTGRDRLERAPMGW